MKTKKINIDKLAETIDSDLDDYVKNLNANMQTAAEDAAGVLEDEIARTAPRASGHYAKSWTHTKTFKKSGSNHTIVYSTDYRIAHLLENGHNVVRNGHVCGYYRPHPHIAPAAEKASEYLISRLKGEL
jgi:hypothetical protein